MVRKNLIKEETEFIKIYSGLYRTDLSMNSINLLCYMINVEPIINCWIEDYFRLSNSFIQNFMNISNHVIKTSLKELEDAGLIKLRTGTKVKDSCIKERFVHITKKAVDLINNPAEIDCDEDTEYYFEDGFDGIEEEDVIETVKPTKSFTVPYSEKDAEFDRLCEKIEGCDKFSDRTKEELIDYIYDVQFENFKYDDVFQDICKAWNQCDQNDTKFLMRIIDSRKIKTCLALIELGGM